MFTNNGESDKSYTSFSSVQKESSPEMELEKTIRDMKLNSKTLNWKGLVASKDDSFITFGQDDRNSAGINKNSLRF
jgi:hypothetical protein